MATAMRADARRNRERILEGARQAFAEHGEAAQMDDIARRAGVGVGTLYRHFATKDVLIGELIRVKLADFAVRVRRWFDDESDPWESFAGVLREQTEVMAGDAAHQKMPFAATPDALERADPAIQELRAAWEAMIGRAQEAGVVRKDLSVDDIRTMMCGLGSMMAADAASAMSFDWRRHRDLFLDGVRTKP